MFTYEEVSNIDIMTKTRREGMMKIANNKKGKPPIWHDDVPRDGFLYVILRNSYDVFTWRTTRRFVCFHLFFNLYEELYCSVSITINDYGATCAFLIWKVCYEEEKC